MQATTGSGRNRKPCAGGKRKAVAGGATGRLTSSIEKSLCHSFGKAYTKVLGGLGWATPLALPPPCKPGRAPYG